MGPLQHSPFHHLEILSNSLCAAQLPAYKRRNQGGTKLSTGAVAPGPLTPLVECGDIIRPWGGLQHGWGWGIGGIPGQLQAAVGPAHPQGAETGGAGRKGRDSSVSHQSS